MVSWPCALPKASVGNAEVILQSSLKNIYQSHEGAVDTGTDPKCNILRDTSVNGGVYNDGHRKYRVEYPGFTSNTRVTMYFGGSDSIDERLHRPKYHKLWAGSLININDYAQTINYKYNGTSRVAAIYSDTNKLDLGLWRSSSSGDYDSFDRFGRTEIQEWQRTGGTRLDEVNYTYDFAGNRLSRNVIAATNDIRDQTYTYDGLQRLTNVYQGTYDTEAEEIDTPDFRQQWTLDQLGNWATFQQDDDGGGASWELDQDRDHNEANELTDFTTTSWVDPDHDDAGNMTTTPQPASPTSGYTLVYDAWNRLIEVKTGGSTVVQKNEYDGIHRRIIRDSDDNPSDGDERHFYYNDQWQVVSEFVGGTPDGGGTADAIYSYHPHYIDAVALRMRDSSAHSVHTHFFLHDANYNVTAAVDATSGTGNYRTVIERYAYTPYGEVTFLDSSFGSIGSSAIGNANLYLYARSAPAHFMDPDGLAPIYGGSPITGYPIVVPPGGDFGFDPTPDPVPPPSLGYPVVPVFPPNLIAPIDPNEPNPCPYYPWCGPPIELPPEPPTLVLGCEAFCFLFPQACALAPRYPRPPLFRPRPSPKPSPSASLTESYLTPPTTTYRPTPRKGVKPSPSSPYWDPEHIESPFPVWEVSPTPNPRPISPIDDYNPWLDREHIFSDPDEWPYDFLL